jgi:uncharacterized protein (TIGR00369 family)
VCGRDNDVGLKMVWENHLEKGEIRSTVTVSERFNGYPGIVHGGILAAILDETAGRAILLEGDPDELMVTAKLEVAYRRPTPTDTPLLLVGRLVSRTETRAEAEAEVRLPNGMVSARGRVLLARPPKEILAGWKAERPYFKVDD